MTSSRTGQIGLLALAALAADMGKDLARIADQAGPDPEPWRRKGKRDKPASGGPGGPKVKLRIPGGRR